MSNVGDALTGSGGSGVTDPTGSSSFGDTPNLTDSDFAGLTDADIMGGSGGGPSEFSQFSDLTNALSSGSPVGSSVGAQSASMTPPGTAAATGGDPIGATGGTQSNTTPGATPNQNQQQQGGGGGGQHDPDHAPPTAVAELKTLLKGLSGQPTGPTGPLPQGGQAQPFALPTLAAGQTGARSPQMTLPAVAAGQTGGQSPGSFYGTSVQPQTTGVNDIVGGAGGANPADAAIPPGAAQQRTAAAAGDDGAPAVDAQGNPVTAAGTPAADTPTPPPRPGANISADAGGRQINVRKGGGASPVATGDLPTRVPHPAAALPTHKPGASAAPATGPATSGILNDITGASTGSPTALADLAQAAKTLLPIVLPLLMGGMGGGRRFGRFHGGGGFGRFGGFRGGMNAMRYHGGQHPMARGAWPYHHPQFGWHMHGRPPGPGWLPLHPNDAQGLVGGQGQPGQPGQQDPNAPDPNKPPAERDGGAGGQPDDEFLKSGYSSNPFIDALVTQESGGQGGIISRTDKDSRGLTLAKGGNPNEISQGYFQIQNHPGGTWETYGRQAGIDLNKYPTPRSAPLAVQWQVASRIPIGQWGDDTKALLQRKFGTFDPKMPFGQVAARFNRAGGSLAQKPSHIQPAWAAAAPPPTLPLTSQPMVAGQ